MKYRIIDRIRALGLIMVVAFVTTVQAGEQDVLTPLLMDLPGWEAAQPEGMNMDMGTTKMTSATRNYTKDNSSIDAIVMVGNHSMTQGQMQEMNVETTDVKISVSDINGFKVHTGYNKNENSGSVTVFLSQSETESGLFIFSYQGLSENEALNLAKKFDWNKIKGVVDTLL